MAKRPAAPTREILEAALQGLEAQKQKLDEQLDRVRAMIGRRVGRPPKANGAEANVSRRAGAARKKRSLSAEARKRIAAAQKKRWAAFRKSQT
jgi:peptidoglycan hydrolase CwlO-like protein